MKVLKDFRLSYPQDPTRFFEFEEFEKEAGDFALIEGLFDSAKLKIMKENKVVYLEFEEPNRFCSKDYLLNNKNNDEFYKIFSICPFTTDWLNKKHKNNKRTAVFFPFNKKHIPQPKEKNFDVIYTGHVVHKEILNLARTISKFNYRFVSASENKLVTDCNVSYKEKLDLIARSKIMIVHNLLYLSKEPLNNVLKIKDYRENEAFKLIPKKYAGLKRIIKGIEVPQLKSRAFEAAFSKTLILCRKDDFNIIEKYFKPNEEFLYYEKNNLKTKITEILDNYESYKEIIENAYYRAVKEYTTEAFFKKYLKELK